MFFNWRLPPFTSLDCKYILEIYVFHLVNNDERCVYPETFSNFVLMIIGFFKYLSSQQS